MIRGPYQKKKHCKRGHERTPNNVGMLQESPTLCEAAAAYLRKWGK